MDVFITYEDFTENNTTIRYNKEIATEYDISPKKAASILDTFSCFFQAIIPYGAQMLVAITAVTELGGTISAFEIIPLLFYPYLLVISSLIFIFFVPSKKKGITA